MEHSKAAPASIRVQRKVEWSDTDASGHYHNGLVFRLCEVAETALFQGVGLLEHVYGRIPRVHVTVDFQSVLYFGDVVDVFLQVVSVGTTSINYGVEIRRGDDVCAKAKVVAVLVKPDGGPRPWPEDYKEALLSAGPLQPELLTTRARSVLEEFRETPWNTRVIPGDER
ncbi:MAG: 2-aminobenzoate-CoA ligase [Actinomycetota bacterium]|jgi:2-aminobenzoate-CoA ligase|nr:2-aminobenzoate-CoA ligase [Actinomycetota bacterium]